MTRPCQFYLRSSEPCVRRSDVLFPKPCATNLRPLDPQKHARPVFLPRSVPRHGFAWCCWCRVVVCVVVIIVVSSPPGTGLLLRHSLPEAPRRHGGSAQILHAGARVASRQPGPRPTTRQPGGSPRRNRHLRHLALPPRCRVVVALGEVGGIPPCPPGPAAAALAVADDDHVRPTWRAASGCTLGVVILVSLIDKPLGYDLGCGCRGFSGIAAQQR